MDCTVNDTLRYVLLLTRHIQKGDVTAAILIVLIELGFPTQCDGFGHLRKAIILKYNNPDQNYAQLYGEVGQQYEPEAGTLQVEQAIRSAIETAWNMGNEEDWALFFPRKKNGEMKKPSNSEFISRLACIMELWDSCCREVSYGR